MLKKNSFNKIYLFLIYLIIFLIPSNLFFKIDISDAYVNGLLVDYLIPKVYLSDIFILTLLSLWSIKVILNKKKKLNFKPLGWYFLSILISIITIRQIFTPYPLAAAWYLLKLIEMGFFGLFLITHKKLLQKTPIYFAIISTILFQSGLAIWQFLTQKSLVGFSFLGEPNLANSVGLAKDMWWHTGRVLPYATTAHPNILGGVLAIFSLFLITQTRHKILTSITILLAIITIILTQSISALTSLIIGVLLVTLKLFYQKIISINKKLLIGFGITIIVVPLLINLTARSFETASLTRRSYLQTAAISMFSDHLIIGVGLNQFTAKVEQYSDSPEIVRFVQPVHHIGLLWLAETGLLGILFLWLLIKKINLKKIILPLLILLPIITLDHYLLTQQTGLLLVTFFIIMEKDLAMGLEKETEKD